MNNSRAAFIAVDWGTSNARFALCDAGGRAIEIRKGPGAVASRGRFPQAFDEATAGWGGEHGAVPALLCGMAGSAIGWVEAPYLPCPAELDELAGAAVSIRADTVVVPGMRCTNPLGAPDVMRGEETQLLGACQLHPELAHGHQLLCLPGTHTKWVALSNGVVQEFLTAPTGELYATLCEHTVLVRDPATPLTHVAEDFERGLAEATRHPGVLLQQLFQARSLRLDKQLSAEGAASWMSGLLIASDVHGALALFEEQAVAPAGAPVIVIGTAQLTASYARALQRQGRVAMQIDGFDAALAGLARVFQERQQT